LKFRDWGKMAATFVDVSNERAIRVAAKESSKTLAQQMYPELTNKNQQQMRAYREMRDEDLFHIQWVRVALPPEEFPGYKASASCVRGVLKASTSNARSSAERLYSAALVRVKPTINRSSC